MTESTNATGDGRQDLYAVGFGAHHPERRLTSGELEERFSMAPGRIEKLLGIRERRIADDQTVAEMGAVAAEQAVGEAGWVPAEVDLLIVASSCVDELVPATASYVAQALGTDAVAFDVNACCSSYPVGIEVAAAMMARNPAYERVVVCATDKASTVADYDVKQSCLWFGDGAGAIALQQGRPARGARLVDTELINDNERAEKVTVPRHGHFSHDGRFAFRQVVRLTAAASRAVLERQSLSVSDLRGFVGHQSSMKVLDAVTAELGIEENQHWHNVEWAGNQAGAGVASALAEGLTDHADQLRSGDFILIATVGAGFAAGACLFEWVADD